MAKLKHELKNMDVAQLHDQVVSLRSQLFSQRLKAASGQLKDVAEIKRLKKHIARALTHITAKEAS